MPRLARRVLVLISVASPLPAQRLTGLASGIVVPASCAVAPALLNSPSCLTSEPVTAQGNSEPRAWSVLLSAVLPGGGQALNGSSRAFVYLAVESFAWSSFTRHSMQYRRRRDGYRDLAARVARAAFSDVRPNGDFEYYERMTHFPDAGRYDLNAGGGLDPETDTTTYNGAVWLLARRTYWSDPRVAPDTATPEWRRAVAFYTSRAYDQLYRWSWTEAPLEYARFRTLIEESNDANRLAMVDLGVVIANHVLSTVDAYISFRLHHDPRRKEFAVAGRFPLPLSRR
jgi:hypothetical protein